MSTYSKYTAMANRSVTYTVSWTSPGNKLYGCLKFSWKVFQTGLWQGSWRSAIVWSHCQCQTTTTTWQLESAKESQLVGEIKSVMSKPVTVHELTLPLTLMINMSVWSWYLGAFGATIDINLKLYCIVFQFRHWQGWRQNQLSTFT